MKRLTTILLLSVFVIGLPAVALRILHTNDSHGAYHSVPGACGSYESLWEHLDHNRSTAERSIYLDAGDQQTGSAFSAQKYAGAVGGAVIAAFNRLGLDAATYGNHEYDHSPENIQRLTHLANFPFINSNIVNKDDGKPRFKPWHIIEKDGVKVGIMGLMTLELGEKVKAQNVADISLLPYKQAVELYLDEVDRASDLVVLITHNGFEADSLLATQLDGRVDLIIGGHSHHVLEPAVQVNGIWIAQAGSHLRFLGVLDLEVEDDRITSLQSRLEPITLEASKENPLSFFVKQVSDEIEAELGRVIAHLPVDWQPNKYESTVLSKWMANALYKQYQDVADIAILNNGGFRRFIAAGDVTLRDMHEMLPFENYVNIFSCYGRDLIAWLGLNEADPIAKAFDVCDYSDIDTGALQADKLYRVVSHDYLVGQWDKYLAFEPFDVHDTGELILDAILRQLILEYGVER
jgi:2',3'-cyclic-nucleotide 2'-phosphodiesterase (5'-nucleotidase family)